MACSKTSNVCYAQVNVKDENFWNFTKKENSKKEDESRFKLFFFDFFFLSQFRSEIPEYYNGK